MSKDQWERDREALLDDWFSFRIRDLDFTRQAFALDFSAKEILEFVAERRAANAPAGDHSAESSDMQPIHPRENIA